ncbi:MAG: hypothetical protein ACYCOR_07775 [Acidobacteriaceae bacterium]
MSPQKDERIMIGRAKNALLSFFEQRLSVPKIFLDADWEGEKVDVLAIDRAGVGDVSVALVHETSPSTEAELIQKLHSLPAHFKYFVTISQVSNDLATGVWDTLSRFPPLFAEDGIGRIGYILVDFKNERPSIIVPISAERFRSNQEIYDLADTFASSHTADFEVRP